MRNYITGTTRGLGKALLEVFSGWKGSWEGLDRPKYNLSNVDKYVKTDFDTYVINAHYEYSQIELLYKLFEANKNRKCNIVVIGSVSADGDRKTVNQYAIQKKALDAAVTQLQLVQSEIIITNIKLGRIDTDLVAHLVEPKMDVYLVAQKILNVLLHNESGCYFKTLTIDTKEQL